MVTVRITIVPIVREALKLMRLCFSVLVLPSASFRYSAHLYLGVGNFCWLAFGFASAARYLAMDSCYDRQSWALFG